MGALNRELFKVPEVMERLRMSRTVIYEQMRNGRLRYVKQGRATLITETAIRNYVALLESESEVRYGQTA
ncbi:helix-turn-helix domain-containing protein [Actinophytocola xanthii]|uniref:DNA-binding protein n=1 Tax=Actinophytocola xanthii TaxID=1912961 RepID=A0A1Q8CBZ5_9PSEU|nr:helix-turn-helix domain-containing protein [Actinophytocola xanthii]OLF11866.1 DNA-binding protein [Actinophytocola xanthii]